MKGVDIVRIAEKYLGVKEEPSGSNLTPFGAWYGVNGNAWCMMFVSYIFNEAGCLSLLGGKFAQCKVYEEMALKRKENVPVSAAQPGDVVTFGGTQFSKSEPHVAHHVGIVVENLGGGRLKTIEGNTADSVAYRERSSCVRYVFRPCFDENNLKEEQVLKVEMIKKGSKNNSVRLAQLLLNCDCDGIFGTKTELAVLAFQRCHDLEVDGIVGPLTWKCLFGEALN